MSTLIKMIYLFILPSDSASVLDWTGSPTFQVPTNHSKNGTSTRFFESHVTQFADGQKESLHYIFVSVRTLLFFYLHSHLMNLCIIFLCIIFYKQGDLQIPRMFRSECCGSTKKCTFHRPVCVSVSSFTTLPLWHMPAVLTLASVEPWECAAVCPCLFKWLRMVNPGPEESLHSQQLRGGAIGLKWCLDSD